MKNLNMKAGTTTYVICKSCKPCFFSNSPLFFLSKLLFALCNVLVIF